MATISVTKVSVSEVQPKLFSITLNLKVVDGETTLIDQNFSEKYRTGDAPSKTTLKLGRAMQAAIDEYQSEQELYNKAALDTAISTLEGALTW